MRDPDIFFTPVPDRVLAEMFRIAAITSDDTVLDLGSGDGRIVITAARDWSARGIGIDIDPTRIAESLANAARAGVSDCVEFRQQDFLEACLSEATLITLYLLDSLNIRLRPKILSECAPGTRIVSYSFEMGEWEADAHTPIAANGVFLWIVPANLSGVWSTADESTTGGIEALHIVQTFQILSGDLRYRGMSWDIHEARATGERFTLKAKSSHSAESLFITGQIHGETIDGFMTHAGIETPILLNREPAISGNSGPTFTETKPTNAGLSTKV